MTSCSEQAPDTSGAHTHPETGSALVRLSQDAEGKHATVMRMLKSAESDRKAMGQIVADNTAAVAQSTQVSARITQTVERMAALLEKMGEALAGLPAILDAHTEILADLPGTLGGHSAALEAQTHYLAKNERSIAEVARSMQAQMVPMLERHGTVLDRHSKALDGQRGLLVEQSAALAGLEEQGTSVAAAVAEHDQTVTAVLAGHTATLGQHTQVLGSVSRSVDGLGKAAAVQQEAMERHGSALARQSHVLEGQDKVLGEHSDALSQIWLASAKKDAPAGRT